MQYKTDEYLPLRGSLRWTRYVYNTYTNFKCCNLNHRTLYKSIKLLVEEGFWRALRSIIYDVIDPIMESFKKTGFSFKVFLLKVNKTLLFLFSPTKSRLQEIRGEPPLFNLQEGVSVPEGEERSLEVLRPIVVDYTVVLA